jgi:hypothetical protein
MPGSQGSRVSTRNSPLRIQSSLFSNRESARNTQQAALDGHNSAFFIFNHWFESKISTSPRTAISTKSVFNSFHFSIPDDIDSKDDSIEIEDIDPQSGNHLIHAIQIDVNRLNKANWASAKE